MIRVATKKNVEPYSALAQIYDQVMYHVNYKRWASYIHQIISRYRPGTNWIVDMTCGTGTFGLSIQKYGYQVTGFDSSLPMLREATRKTYLNFHGIACADICHLPLGNQPDVIVSLYDSMNYLLESKLWRTSLLDVYNCLPSGGLFVFDVSTLHNSQRDFSRYVQKEKFAGGSYHRRSSFDYKNQIQINYFEIRLKQHPGTVFCETHRQRIRPLTQIVEFIDESPFTFIAGYKEFSFKTYTENCERVHFVLKK